MRLIFLELNEINFDVIGFYIKNGERLPGFEKLLNHGMVSTKAESEYAHLEPWIQWPSVHTGKSFREHKIFRLGDFVNSGHEQFFEKIEKAGYSVGAISPMNASNRLISPAYFIPDPWTKTSSDDSFLSRKIAEALVQAVNDNSQSKLTFKTLLNLSIAFFTLVQPSRYVSLIRYAYNALGKPWRKALFLDMLLFEFHNTLLRRKKPNFSTLFLNAGAHIQHHYFFNSRFVKDPELKNPSWYVEANVDPFLEMLHVYDEIMIELLAIPDTELIIATGLSQKPYKRLKYYYRLKDHATFLKTIGVQFRDVAPRMTRDFLVSFDTAEQALAAELQLSEIKVNNEVRLFGEIDNRGNDLFLTLTYPSEITNKTKINCSIGELPLEEFVTFVAIKNGEHQSKGFAYFSKGVEEHAPIEGDHVSKIYNSILGCFGISC